MRDTSAVFPREVLDTEHAANFTKPWLLETELGIQGFDTEHDACAMQRRYRAARGFDPITGEGVNIA